MHDKELYSKILGIESPWKVTDIELDQRDREVRVHLASEEDRPPCPECGKSCPGYDSRRRRWRHLDTCQYRTILVADVPRIECQEHGVMQVRVPWGEPGSRFTALMEALAIDWLKEASLSAVSRMLGLSWKEVDTIQGRSVRRGLARRAPELPAQLGVDETSFQKRHEYVTVICDRSRDVVVHVADGRGRETLEDFLKAFPEESRAQVESVTMDMWPGFIAATQAQIPEAESKIAYDKFHVAQHLGKAVDKVRREEHRSLLATGSESLKGSKYLWLQNPGTLSPERRETLDALRSCALKTARAWGLKELAMSLWHYRHRGWARKAWQKWYSWAIRSRLEPIRKVARMVRTHLEGILNAIVLGVTNARAEGINAKIQWLKFNARGFRNRERFRNAIYFHLGGLDLYPDGLKR
jgi:transposase